MKILIMGLSGSGKTTLAKQLQKALDNADWLNADVLREREHDWDFSEAGRLRQASRVAILASFSDKKYVIADFIAALPEQRGIFNADFVIWMNTVEKCKYKDTNQAFVPPEDWDIRFNTFREVSLEKILKAIKSKQ